MIERAHYLVLIGVVADEFGALCIHVCDEDKGKVLALPFSRLAELFCAMNMACVMAEPVASILAPLTMMPSSRSLTRRIKTSATS
jgi:hypothetical protein